MPVRFSTLFLPLIAAAFCACAHQVAPPTSGVALMGDTEAELRHAMQTARDAGKHPLYASVSYGSRTYLFSPYAQIVRTPSAVVVRAYAHVYVFPLASEVRYDGATVGLDQLPQVAPAEDNFDAWNGVKDPWQRGATLVPWTKGDAYDAQAERDLTP